MCDYMGLVRRAVKRVPPGDVLRWSRHYSVSHSRVAAATRDSEYLEPSYIRPEISFRESSSTPEKKFRPFSRFLTDGYARQHNYLRISITEKCNLRCTYCMPEEGVKLQPEDEALSSDEIARLAKLFVQEGVTKIRLTGGEPTVRKDIGELVGRLGQLRAYGLKELAMTSNGIALKRNLPALVQAGLTNLNLSLDTLDPFRYTLITRRKGLETVLETIDLAISLGMRPLKVNCVVIKGLNEEEIPDFVEFTQHRPLEVRFIEYMPFDGNKWNANKIISYDEMLSRIREKLPTITKVFDQENETSKGWHVPGYVGSIGFVTSMTNHFCGSCNRLRITSDGNLKVCLFGNTEVSLRDMMRASSDDQKLLHLIGAAVKRKKKQHAGLEQLATMKNRSMVRIGG